MNEGRQRGWKGGKEGEEGERRMWINLTCDFIVQVEALYKHPHEHGCAGVFQKDIGGLTKHRLFWETRKFG